MVLIIRPTVAKIDYKEGNILNNYLTFFSLSGLWEPHGAALGHTAIMFLYT